MIEIEDPATGRRHRFLPTSGEVTLGRAASCALQIDSHSASQQHARLLREPGGWILEDLGSTNGTTLNRRPVQRAVLHAGDRIGLGDRELLVLGAPGHLGATTQVSNGLLFGTASEATLIRSRAMPPDTGSRCGDTLPSNGHSLQARLATWLPSLAWLYGYRASDFRHDLIAGATTAALLVPQGMAYAALAGLPPVVGLYAALLPLLVYALFGTSPQLSVGPVTLDSLLVATIVGTLAATGTSDYLAAATTLALLAGVLQLLLGLLRAGFLVNFLSSPVICGFSSAAALITAATQLDTLLGLSLPGTLSIFDLLRDLIAHLDSIRWPTALLGLAAILTLLLGKWLRMAWVPLVLMIAATTATAWLGAAGLGLEVVGTVPQGLPTPVLPALDPDLIRALLPGALTLALVGFMQTITVGKTLALRRRAPIHPDQEMRALGLANIAAGLTQGYSVAGGLSRSTVNANAGARTQLSSVIAAALVAAILLWATPFLHDLPLVVLAALVFTSIFSLVNIAEIRRIHRVRSSESVLLALTFIATLAAGIQLGVLIGIGASILLFIVLNTKPNAALLGRMPGTDIYRSLDNFPSCETVPGILILRIDASFYFANCEFIRNKLRDLLATRSPRAIILEAGAINDLDSSADAALHEIADELDERGVALFVANVKGPVREVMKRSGFYDRLGAGRFFFSIGAAVERAVAEQAGAAA